MFVIYLGKLNFSFDNRSSTVKQTMITKIAYLFKQANYLIDFNQL